jgi:hypothetical protein
VNNKKIEIYKSMIQAIETHDCMRIKENYRILAENYHSLGGKFPQDGEETAHKINIF